MYQNNFGWGNAPYGSSAQYGWGQQASQPSYNYGSSYGASAFGQNGFGQSGYIIQDAPLPPRYPSWNPRPVAYYPDPVWINGIAAGGVPSKFQIPVYQPPKAPVYCPPPPTQYPCYPPQQYPICPPAQSHGWYCPPPIGQVRGRAAALGDPYFSLETPGLGTIPQPFKGIPIDLPDGETITLLSDPDCGGLELLARGATTNPSANDGATGIDQLSLNIGQDDNQQNLVFRAEDKALLLNGEVIATLDDDVTGPKRLPCGVPGYYGTIQTKDYEGNPQRQFVLLTPQYRISASVTEPGVGQTNFLNITVDEMTVNAANNATGDKQIFYGVINPTTGENARVSLADLLAIEPGNPLLQWTQYR